MSRPHVSGVGEVVYNASKNTRISLALRGRAQELVEAWKELLV